MGTAPVTPAPGAEVIKKTYKYFDLESFDEKSEQVEVTFMPAGSYGEAMQRISGDEATALKAINAFLQRLSFSEKRREIAAKGAPRKTVLGVAKAFRSLPPWDAIKDRKEQTKSILSMIRQNTAIVEAIKAASLKAAEAGDEEEDDEEE